jgi:hypothetical protein
MVKAEIQSSNSNADMLKVLENGISEEQLIKNRFALDMNEVEKKFYTKRTKKRTVRPKKYYC